MRLQLCKVRRRCKTSSEAVTHPAEDIIVDESENELLVDENGNGNMNGQNRLVMKEINIENNHLDVQVDEYVKQGILFPDEFPDLDKGEQTAENEVREDKDEVNREEGAHEGNEDKEGVNEQLATLKEQSNYDDDKLASLLQGVTLLPPGEERSFTRDFSNLQNYCKNRLYDIMADKEVSLKCVTEIVPSLAQKCLAASVECKTFPPLVRQCLGIQDASEKVEQECNEFRVVEERENLDMPTIPTGIWVVDSINEALDGWSDGETSQAMGNLFKLLNFTALLTYFGDSSGDKIANILSRTSSIVSRGPEAWREILRRMTTEGMVEDKPLPNIPNASFASKCETKLDDVPDIDTVQCGEGPFRVYWLYTEKWMRRHFNPAIVNSNKLLERTRDWFNSLESSSQDLFIRLSRTLCCNRP